MRRWRRFGFTLAVVLAARPGFTQSDEQLASRRILIDQAEQARNSGDHERALRLAQQAAQIQITPSHRLFIAEEQRALGHLAAALGTADTCVREAGRDTAFANRETILGRCRALLDALRQTVGSVTVQVPQPIPTGLEVRVGRELLDANLYGLPDAVAAGHVAIDASAPGHVAFHRDLDVAAGAVVDVRLELPVSESASNVPAASPASPPPSAATVTSSAPSSAGFVEPAPTTASLPVGGIAVAGVGVVGFIAAGVFAAARASSISTCTMGDGVLNCPVAARSTVTNGYEPFTIATDVALAAGGVALAAGVLWIVLGRHRERPPAGVGVHLVPDGHGAHIGLSAIF